jgi:hypothetical protein
MISTYAIIATISSSPIFVTNYFDPIVATISTNNNVTILFTQ